MVPTGFAVGRAQVEYCHKYEQTGKISAGVPTGVDHIFVKHACFERKVRSFDDRIPDRQLAGVDFDLTIKGP